MVRDRLCTVCARAGSKGVKNKNILPIAGKPLIVHTLQQAKDSTLFACIAVSSDSPEILAIAKDWGADILVQRPAELATDQAPKLPVVKHCLLEVEQKTGKKYETIVDLDPTSPLRSVQDIVEATNLLEQSGVSNVLTAAPARRSPYFNLVELDENKTVRLSKKGNVPLVRRQDAPQSYDCNASIYPWHREALLKAESVFCNDTKLFVMPEERSLDIDSEFDLKIVTYLLENRR